MNYKLSFGVTAVDRRKSLQGAPFLCVFEFAPGLLLEGNLVFFQGCYLLFEQYLQHRDA